MAESAAVGAADKVAEDAAEESACGKSKVI